MMFITRITLSTTYPAPASDLPKRNIVDEGVALVLVLGKSVEVGVQVDRYEEERNRWAKGLGEHQEDRAKAGRSEIS